MISRSLNDVLGELGSVDREIILKAMNELETEVARLELELDMIEYEQSRSTKNRRRKFDDE